MDSFERIQRLRDSYESALDEAERIRDEYHREIVKLHRSGMSLREIADGLGISHQRVHQIVSPHEEKPRSKTRRAAAGGAVAALVLVVGLAVALSRGTPELPSVRPAPSAQPPSGRCSPSLSETGSRIATLDFAAQACAERLTESGAIVLLDPTTGEILALYGQGGSRRLLRQVIACEGPRC